MWTLQIIKVRNKIRTQEAKRKTKTKNIIYCWTVNEKWVKHVHKFEINQDNGLENL